MREKVRTERFDAATIADIKRYAGSHPAFYRRASSYLKAGGIRTLMRYYQVVSGDLAREDEIAAIHTALERLYKRPAKVLADIGERLQNAPEAVISAYEYGILYGAILDVDDQ